MSRSILVAIFMLLSLTAAYPFDSMRMSATEPGDLFLPMRQGLDFRSPWSWCLCSHCRFVNLSAPTCVKGTGFPVNMTYIFTESSGNNIHILRYRLSDGHELRALRSVRRVQSRSKSASSRTCGKTLPRDRARHQSRTSRGGRTVSKSNTDRHGRLWLGVCPRLAVRSGTCRNALSNDAHGGRSVQGRCAGAIR